MSRRHGSGDGNWCAVPGVHTGASGDPVPVALTIEVDGERFAVREAVGGGWAYEWVSGPNEGYGFATSGLTAITDEQHRQAIRSFLSMIDPATGYIGDDAECP